jgi:hypothetical protein
MNVALLLARFWGLILIALCLPLLRKKTFVDLVDSINTEQAVFLYSLIAIILGALSIAILNSWTIDFKGVITLFAWGSLIKGFVGLLAPKASIELVSHTSKRWPLVFLLLVFYIIIGVWLCYIGFEVSLLVGGPARPPTVGLLH